LETREEEIKEMDKAKRRKRRRRRNRRRRRTMTTVKYLLTYCAVFLMSSKDFFLVVSELFANLLAVSAISFAWCSKLPALSSKSASRPGVPKNEKNKQ